MVESRQENRELGYRLLGVKIEGCVAYWRGLQVASHVQTEGREV